MYLKFKLGALTRQVYKLFINLWYREYPPYLIQFRSKIPCILYSIKHPDDI